MWSFSGIIALCALAIVGCAAAATEDSPPTRLTVLYDNWVGVAPTEADWGFAVLVETGSATVLFDTGTKPWVLRHNLRTLGVDLAKVDTVVLSHNHADHTGGLFTVLEQKHDLEVHVPTSFTEVFAAEVEHAGARVVRSGDRRQIADGVWVTAEMGDEIIEQGLAVETGAGLLLITGCAHPGVVEMTRATTEAFDRPVHTVVGGFHLMRHEEGQLAAVIEALKKLGVTSAGPTHCSGERALEAFRAAFGEHFIAMGSGRVVEVE
jgi:7,8-dihydropterin-6-yl-methyl-4-(beta-D-ribofuranosyl)aminobenzene 5'-phosphate synthase